ncbi:MAG: hypothetical protein ABIQ86_06505 [Steroidobacteraceae bacterium]
MLKTVGTSGQLSLGKKLAGHHFEMEHRADGSIVLVPVTISRAGHKAASSRPARTARPRFHVFKVERFDLPTRDDIHQRAPVR